MTTDGLLKLDLRQDGHPVRKRLTGDVIQHLAGYWLDEVSLCSSDLNSHTFTAVGRIVQTALFCSISYLRATRSMS